ncbi:LasR-specific antiactivator QslA, partial [Pseudomonas aeruginosa]|uniref:LasR-specific antiactivator QslA n=1 Tax=Pseudomonas aeruginosa TaxID=287 RepID=UPI003F6A3684
MATACWRRPSRSNGNCASSTSNGTRRCCLLPSPCSKRTTSNASRPTPAIDKGVRQAENWLADQIEGQLWTA